MSALKRLQRAQDRALVAQSRIVAAQKAGASRKHLLQLCRHAMAATRFTDTMEKRKKTKPGAIHVQKYPDKGTRRIFRAWDRKLAREERRNAARARMAAERLQEEMAEANEKRKSA